MYDATRRFFLLALITAAATASPGPTAHPEAGDSFFLRDLPAAKADGPFEATFVEDRDHVAVFEVNGNYDRSVGGEFNLEPRRQLGEEFYGHHPDDFDFLFIFTTFEYDTGGAAAFHVGIQNDVAGLGLDFFDNSAELGSDGRLLGLIEMAALDRWPTRRPGLRTVSRHPRPRDHAPVVLLHHR